MIAPTSGDRGTLDVLIAKAEQILNTGVPASEGLVHNDLYRISDDSEVVGFVSLQHELNGWLRQFGGHIGYTVGPRRRR